MASGPRSVREPVVSQASLHRGQLGCTDLGGSEQLVAHRWSGTNLISGTPYGHPFASVLLHTVPLMGRRHAGRWARPRRSSLEEVARGTDAHELDEPMPMYVWFKLPDRLIRRDDAVARSMTRDAVWVEVGGGETKLEYGCGGVRSATDRHRDLRLQLGRFHLRSYPVSARNCNLFRTSSRAAVSSSLRVSARRSVLAVVMSSVRSV